MTVEMVGGSTSSSTAVQPSYPLTAGVRKRTLTRSLVAATRRPATAFGGAHETTRARGALMTFKKLTFRAAAALTVAAFAAPALPCTDAKQTQATYTPAPATSVPANTSKDTVTTSKD